LCDLALRGLPTIGDVRSEKIFWKIGAVGAGALATWASGDYPAGLPRTLFGGLWSPLGRLMAVMDWRLLL
jgi:hypothetical protein